MKVGFRADASPELGTGHLMRCRALARSLQRRGAEIVFFSSSLPEWLTGELMSDGFRYVQLDRDRNEVEKLIDELKRESAFPFDWLVVDHYEWGERQESAIAPYVKHVMVIDDLANRRHYCDLLLDQNDFYQAHSRYEGLIPLSARKLLGPQYALLREEFAASRENLKMRDGNVRTLFVCFGGSDPTNETTKALDALDDIRFTDLTIQLVVGRSHPCLDQIVQRCQADSRIRLHIQSGQVAKLMADSDLALAAGGTMTWERYCMGLPGIIIAVADNQIEIAASGQRAGVDWYLGESRQVRVDHIRSTLLKAMNNPECLRSAQSAAFARVDGRGTDKVAEIMVKAVECQ